MINMINDYFKYFMYQIDDDLCGTRKDIAEIINTDIEKYRNFSIKQYNNDKEKGTDEFCFRNFLNDYNVAINIFGLHSELDCKGSFNRFITGCFGELSAKED